MNIISYLQGITIRPLATYLHIERDVEEAPTMIQSVYMRVLSNEL